MREGCCLVLRLLYLLHALIVMKPYELTETMEIKINLKKTGGEVSQNSYWPSYTSTTPG